MTTADLVDGGVEGIDAEQVTRWFSSHVAGSAPPLSFELIAGGRSNLTYRVTDAAGHRYALRRPPLSHVLPTAHDMAREHRVITALWPTPVPVPARSGCARTPRSTADRSTSWSTSTGTSSATPGRRRRLDDAGRRRAGESIADTLAALHGVDVDAVGLGDFAKRDGYIERQLRRWHEQFSNSQVEGWTRRPSSTPCTSGWPPRSSPGGDGDRPRRLPARQHGARRRTDGARRARLGDLHPRRPAGRRGAPDGVLDRSR